MIGIATNFYFIDYKYLGGYTMIKKTLTSLFVIMFLTGTVAAITGCNTMEGAGKDLERGGEKIQEKAS